MTYRVEVTASTINELSGKLAALASQLKGLPSVIELPTVEHTDVSVRIPEVEPSLYQAVMQAVREGDKGASSEASHRVYNYKDDIMPRVLKLASKRGTEVTEGLLKTFGVKRASELDPARHGELLAAIDAAMEG